MINKINEENISEIIEKGQIISSKLKKKKLGSEEREDLIKQLYQYVRKINQYLQDLKNRKY